MHMGMNPGTHARVHAYRHAHGQARTHAHAHASQSALSTRYLVHTRSYTKCRLLARAAAEPIPSMPYLSPPRVLVSGISSSSAPLLPHLCTPPVSPRERQEHPRRWAWRMPLLPRAWHQTSSCRWGRGEAGRKRKVGMRDRERRKREMERRGVKWRNKIKLAE